MDDYYTAAQMKLVSDSLGAAVVNHMLTAQMVVELQEAIAARDIANQKQADALAAMEIDVRALREQVRPRRQVSHTKK